jgi:hypothetical protein
MILLLRSDRLLLLSDHLLPESRLLLQTSARCGSAYLGGRSSSSRPRIALSLAPYPALTRWGFSSHAPHPAAVAVEVSRCITSP